MKPRVELYFCRPVRPSETVELRIALKYHLKKAKGIPGPKRCLASLYARSLIIDSLDTYIVELILYICYRCDSNVAYIYAMPDCMALILPSSKIIMTVLIVINQQ